MQNPQRWSDNELIKLRDNLEAQNEIITHLRHVISEQKEKLDDLTSKFEMHDKMEIKHREADKQERIVLQQLIRNNADVIKSMMEDISQRRKLYDINHKHTEEMYTAFVETNNERKVLKKMHEKAKGVMAMFGAVIGFIASMLGMYKLYIDLFT